jgi:hypothetical protein
MEEDSLKIVVSDHIREIVVIQKCTGFVDHVVGTGNVPLCYSIH